MLLRRFLTWVFLVLLILIPARELFAPPMYTSFEKMMEKSPNIVIAKQIGKENEKDRTVTLEITQVLKGDIKPGKHKISFGAHPRTTVEDGEFVAFLDDKFNWQFAATSFTPKQPIDNVVLAVRGFYDFNAHWVFPGVITVDQLKTYIKDKTLVYRFRGEVYFPQLGKTDWKASSITVTGTYDAIKEKTEVKGLPQLEGFPEQPSVNVHSLHGGRNIDLIYSRSLGRELQILGKVDSLDEKTGEILVKFAIEAPEILTEAAFKEYLGDKKKGGFFATFKLPCVPAKGSDEKRTLSLSLGKWLDGGWDSQQLAGWDKEPIKILEIHYRDGDKDGGYGAGNYIGPERPFPKIIADLMDKNDGVFRMAGKTKSGDSIILAFKIDGGLYPPEPFTWTFQDDFRLALYTKKVEGSLLLYNGKTFSEIATFTPKYDSLGFDLNRWEGSKSE